MTDLGSMLLTCGALEDRFGVWRLYQVGLVLFTGISLLCAPSPGVGFLIGLRMLQGLGAAIMLPASLSLLSHAFPQPQERGMPCSFAVVFIGFVVMAGVVARSIQHHE